jgi:hypothetical protein
MSQLVHTPIDGDMKEKVMALQKAMIQNITPMSLDTKHRFHGGMYLREVFRPADFLIVGKVHKKEHFYIVLSGTVVITTDTGVTEVTGPYIFDSKPGTKRAVYAKTDATCITIHRVESETIEDVENELVEDDPDCVYLSGNTLTKEVIL